MCCSILRFQMSHVFRLTSPPFFLELKPRQKSGEPESRANSQELMNSGWNKLINNADFPWGIDANLCVFCLRFGYSLMDVGTGSIIFSSGVSDSRETSETWKWSCTWLRNAILFAGSLFIAIIPEFQRIGQDLSSNHVFQRNTRTQLRHLRLS